MYLNQATVAGNLTRDPEMKALPSGMNVTNFSVATNRVYKDKDGNKQESVDYHNIVFFGKQAETINQYFKKGMPIYVEGRMQTRSWEKDGQKQYRTEVIGNSFQFVGRKSDGDSSSAPAASTTNRAPEPPAMNDTPEYPEEEINPEDIPF